MRIQEFTCFAAGAGGGNPALVIADGPSGLAGRLNLARERALTVALGHGLTLRQGRATGRDCLIRTAIEGDAVRVGGRVMQG